MTALSRFAGTTNGQKIMASALFLSLSLGTALTVSSAQAAPFAGATSASSQAEASLPIDQLQQKVDEADEQVEVYHARLAENQSFNARYREGAVTLARAVRNIEPIFTLSNDEMPVADKLSQARRIILNNLSVARRSQALFDLAGPSAVPISEPASDRRLVIERAAPGMINTGREGLLADLRTYREQVDYMVDEMDRLAMETAYYRSESVKATNILNDLIQVTPLDETALRQGLAAFAAAHDWKEAFAAEMASTGGDPFLDDESNSLR